MISSRPCSLVKGLLHHHHHPHLQLCNNHLLRQHHTFPTTLRLFSTARPQQYAGKPLPPRPTIDESEITEAFLKGTGPGGQKINKTSSAVQLKHLPTGIVIKCQETRSRSQNRKIARRILAERIEEQELGEASRTALKAERASKKKASKNKKSRRKYRKLAEGGEEGKEVEAEEDEGEDGVEVEGAIEQLEAKDAAEGVTDTSERLEQQPGAAEEHSKHTQRPG